MYKDKQNTCVNNSDLSGPVYAEVDDVLESPIVDNPQLEETIEQGSEQQPSISEPPNPTPVLRRTYRTHVPNRRYMDYMLLTDEGEPEDYAEACQTADASNWLARIIYQRRLLHDRDVKTD
ncbi:hypothetical protein KIW84_072521 [Lathyrus oleraceus]|uniref:Uncharacterized protein n=1 Tax=Pisum sativum TaxID=3888 RepID=A0A9D4VMF5_PEA|nr:hypothetical protein KIW84_072521 [Pisum sativum]